MLGRKRPRSGNANCSLENNADGSATTVTSTCCNNKTSSHFTRSPSSPIGSIASLGSLVDALTGYRKCYCLKCVTDRKCRNPRTTHSSTTTCLANEKYAILGHFEQCPIFCRAIETYFSSRTKHGDSMLMCSKMKKKELSTTRAITLAVGHLCQYNCFLRAFAPARKWHELRASICHYANASPDEVLKGWGCYLKYNDQITQSSQGPKPKVIFVAPNGITLDSGDKVLKALGFIDCTTQRTNVKDSSKQTKEKVHPQLRSLKFKHRSIVESELISSVPLYGLQCKHQHNEPIQTFARRVLYEDIDNDDHAALCDLNSMRDGTLVVDSDIDISPFGLIEELFQNDPWRLLVSTILLNRTCREQVDYVMFKLLENYSDAKYMAKAEPSDISSIIRPLGIRHRRADTLIRFSKEYIALIQAAEDESEKLAQFNLNRSEVTKLRGCGQYAADAYDIFILGRYDDICVSDHALQCYIDHKRGTAAVQKMNE